jgi:hypothetical protein
LDQFRSALYKCPDLAPYFNECVIGRKVLNDGEGESLLHDSTSMTKAMTATKYQIHDHQLTTLEEMMYQ